MPDKKRLTSLLLLIVFLLAAALPLPASAGQRALIQNQGQGEYKPADFCPANHTCFASAEWIRWGSSAVAWATGTTTYPGAPEASARVKVTFSQIQSMCGGRRYTRARWTFPGDSRATQTTFMALSSGCGYWTGG